MSDDPRTLPTNPGGVLDPEHVVGRDALIDEAWDWLGSKSIALLAPRRMGKTSICKRMAARPAPGFQCLWRDVEGLENAQEFVRHAFTSAQTLLSRRQVATTRARDFLTGLFGAVDLQWGNITLEPTDWKDLLERIFEDLHRSAEAGGDVVVLIWDEFPIFIDDLADHSREEATTLLDTLRAIRQTYPRVRMVVTGSIGLNQVLLRLKAHGYNNDPFNDVQMLAVGPLDHRGATALTGALLRGIDETVDDELAAGIALMTEGHPYVIHYVVHLIKRGSALTEERARAALAGLLEDTDDPLAFGHYIDRLSVYAPDRAAQARGLLDLASSPSGTSTAEAVAALGQDRELILDLLRMLCRDHYLSKEAGRYRFRLELLRRWWREHRDVT